MNAPQLSVIVPTYQRRDCVLALLRALDKQNFDDAFEAIVVVDGSSDGTEAAVRAVDAKFPLKVLAQKNEGLARARNRGAEEARGRILLFLDDDMEPDASLLREHYRSHEEGAEVVIGNMPLHADSPRNLLSEGVRIWAGDMSERLSRPQYCPEYDELVGGQISIRRSLYCSLGGFDAQFNHFGAYGGEDIEFGYRLLKAGAKIVFNAEAISWQRYIVEPEQQLRQYRQAGRADVAIVRTHPELINRTFKGKCADSEIHRVIWRPVLYCPNVMGCLNFFLKKFAINRVERGEKGKITAWTYYLARAIEYWRGVHEAGGIPRPRRVRVLCYHSISDLDGDAVLSEYGVPPEVFQHQLDLLCRSGYNFVSPKEFMRFLQTGSGVPRSPVLLTFDDCYEDLITAAAPLLVKRNIKCVAFAVTTKLGGQNDWDRKIGADAMCLLNNTELIELSDKGFEIGGHSRTHRRLDKLNEEEVRIEIAGCMRDLSDLGLGKLRLFAYPYGAYNKRVRKCARKAGVQAAFTVDPGRVRLRQDPWCVPRIEIFRRDQGWRFRLKVRIACRYFSLFEERLYRLLGSTLD